MLLAVISFALETSTNSTILPMPVTEKSNFVETLHGVSVADPFRWLEDANSGATKNWVTRQNAYTQSYLSTLPMRKAIEKKMTEIINYERFSAPQKVGDSYFYSRNDGLQNQSVLYVTDSLKKEGRILLDPNTLSKDGTVALGSTEISPNGKLMAYSVATGGSDWREWRVRDVVTGKDTSDVISWSKFSGASWSKDSSGFYYSAYDAPTENQKLQEANFFQKLYFHKVGTLQSSDTLVFEDKQQKEWGFSGTVSEDGNYLIITNWMGTFRENQIFLAKITNGTAGKVVPLVQGFDAAYAYLGNDGSTLYFATDLAAPNKKVIAVNADNPGRANWKTVIAEGKESIDSISLLQQQFIATYLRDAKSAVVRYDMTGKVIGEVSLPGLGTAAGFGGLRSNKETFFSFATFTTPTTIYRFDLKTNKASVWKKPRVKFNGKNYEVKQVFFTSKDGTRIPMFITAKKGLKLDGSNPTLLYGYGGFNQSLSPGFSSKTATWLEMGGVFAVANIRGGGEYGNAWHDGGKLKVKQNSFDDFIAAGEYLVAQKITSPAKLACNGGSNGGLLVGAVVNQRPDLWAAAVPEVGVMDMLRFDKFTIGWAWKSDYGDPAIKEDFEVLRKYSPLHNIKIGGKYPAILVLTGDNDDRVVPAHSYKYTAAMQAAQAGTKPIFIRVETSAGHGAGTPTKKIIEEGADILAFLADQLKMPIKLK